MVGPVMKVYRGARTIDGIRVEVDGRPLSERHDIKKFTSTGFEWTYEGAGPAQLSLAILAEHLGDGERALALHQPFMREVVANLENDWELTSDDIDAALQRLGAAH
jgi:hypothetical protein